MLATVPDDAPDFAVADVGTFLPFFDCGAKLLYVL
jgi:hypothetical protein